MVRGDHGCEGNSEKGEPAEKARKEMGDHLRLVTVVD